MILLERLWRSRNETHGFATTARSTVHRCRTDCDITRNERLAECIMRDITANNVDKSADKTTIGKSRNVHVLTF